MLFARQIDYLNSCSGEGPLNIFFSVPRNRTAALKRGEEVRRKEITERIISRKTSVLCLRQSEGCKKIFVAGPSLVTKSSFDQGVRIKSKLEKELQTVGDIHTDDKRSTRVQFEVERKRKRGEKGR